VGIKKVEELGGEFRGENLKGSSKIQKLPILLIKLFINIQHISNLS
jgi:hypothetical protein